MKRRKNQLFFLLKELRCEMEINESELLEILKNRLSISIQEEEIPPYYEQNGYVELRVSLSWKMNEKQVEIASDMTRIYLEK